MPSIQMKIMPHEKQHKNVTQIQEKNQSIEMDKENTGMIASADRDFIITVIINTYKILK